MFILSFGCLCVRIIRVTVSYLFIIIKKEIIIVIRRNIALEHSACLQCDALRCRVMRVKAHRKSLTSLCDCSESSAQVVGVTRLS